MGAQIRFEEALKLRKKELEERKASEERRKAARSDKESLKKLRKKARKSRFVDPVSTSEPPQELRFTSTQERVSFAPASTQLILGVEVVP